MNIDIIINKQSLNANAIQLADLEAIVKDFDFSNEIIICESGEIEKALKNAVAKSCDAIIVGGGDGTVRTAAQILNNTNIPLAILPLGTYNHFAKTLNLPDNLETILTLIQENKRKKIDIGVVNNNVFINNASLGLYSTIVREREKYIDLFSRSKLWKLILNIINFFSYLPFYNIAIEINGEKNFYSSCLIFIGNNYYNIDVSNFGERENLKEGQLSLYVLKGKGRASLFKLIAGLIFNKYIINDYLDLYVTSTLTINCRTSPIAVVIDGELIKLETPLEFSIQKNSLLIVSG